MKKSVSVRRKQSHFRQAKAYVISVLGEFAQTCWSKQVIIITQGSQIYLTLLYNRVT